MAQIQVTDTKLQGIKVIQPQVFGDNRNGGIGFFRICILSYNRI